MPNISYFRKLSAHIKGHFRKRWYKQKVNRANRKRLRQARDIEDHRDNRSTLGRSTDMAQYIYLIRDKATNEVLAACTHYRDAVEAILRYESHLRHSNKKQYAKHL